MRVRRRHVALVASEVLNAIPAASAHGFIDPIEIAKGHGIEVRSAVLEDSLSGFLVRVDNGSTFIGINARDGLNRQRFTVAHELGHYFLHDRSETYVDGTAGRTRIMARDELSKEGTDPREIEANLFASELLMPADRVLTDLASHTHIDLFGDESSESVITELAAKYKVSVRAMTLRLERLGYIAEI